MKIMELIKQRRTIRKYQTRKIPQKILCEILQAARFAPSTHNSQPWRFIILTNKRQKQALLLKLNKNLNRFFTSVKILLRKSLEIMETAPCIIFVYNAGTFSKKINFLGKPYSSIAKMSEIQSISASIQNMHLAASSLGIGFAWLVFPLLLEKEINEIIKTDDKLVTLLVLGYPAEKPKATTRKQLKEIAKFLK
jgi:nitroreductase